MNAILKNKSFTSIKEIFFTPKLKEGLRGVFGDADAEKAEMVSKKVRGFEFTYTSKNGKVSGLLALPKSPQKKKIPCIIYNRGGYKDFSILRSGAVFKNLGFLSVEGYVVIASQYSGNSLGEGKDEYGGKDIDDVVALYDILKTIPTADVGKIGVYGGSRGGLMTFLLMQRVKWIKAVCIVSGLYNLVTTAKRRPEMKRVFKEAFGGSREEMIKRSVQYWVKKLPKNIPILMLHGALDERASPLDALETSKQFLECKVPHRLVVFESADHFLTGFSGETSSFVVSWFDTYLKDPTKGK
jgi:dipeptidyl aminopeptidase/acylaminoacyl peptidase